MTETPPAETQPESQEQSTDVQTIDHKPTLTFDSFQLDRRILKALQRLHYTNPTIIQQRVIPVALQGKDCIIKSNTGTGKTISYLIPCIQYILQHSISHNNTVYCIILVPTRELIDQVYKQINDLLYYCNELITVYRLHAYDNTNTTITYTQYIKTQCIQLQAKPNIIITTPTQLLFHYKQHNLSTLINDTLSQLIIDEADLLLSYGYIDDIHALLQYIPKLIQTVLCSATMTTELQQLKRLILHSPVVVNVNTHNNANTQLTQLYIECHKHNDKFLYVYTMLKLGLIKGKILFYVNSIDTAYRLKLLLQQFSITSAVLNAELPYNSRQHTLQQYNKGLFDYLICTDYAVEMDEVSVKKEEPTTEKTDNNESTEPIDVEATVPDSAVDTTADNIQVKTEDEADDTEIKSTEKRNKNKRIKKQHGEYGLTRGIDFQHVNVVINYDFPSTVQSYIHRIGRTARAQNTGLALSLVEHSDTEYLNHVLQHQIEQQHGQTVKPEPELKLLTLNKSDLDGFRYRIDDISRAVTKYSVRDARLAEIKNELMNSTKLKAHFEDNPNELNLIQHNALPTKKVKTYLQHVPGYLVPANIKPQNVTGKTKHVAKHKPKKQFKSKAQQKNEKKQANKKSDPLHSFNV